jgi:hypothetical protein
MTPIKLSDKFTIYIGKYNNKYYIDEFLKYVDINDKLAKHTNDDSVWIEIESPILDSINNQIKEYIEKITNRKFIHYAKHNWVYTQRKNFDMEWMHQHIYVHPPGRSKIKSDFTFTFYLQTTDEIKKDEGKIAFQTEDGHRHKFLPEVGDIFIFDGDLRHTALPTPNSEKERIVFAGSFCMDIFNQKVTKKYLV